MVDTKGYTLLDGVELDDRTVIVAAHHPDYDITTQPHTVFAYRTPDGEWPGSGFTKRLTSSVALNRAHDAILGIDETGILSEYRPGGGSKTEVRPDDPAYFGMAIRFVENIGGMLIAGGAGHCLHISEGGGPWVDATTEGMNNAPEPRGFEDAGGFGPDEFYCVGWNGAIWSRIGGRWAEVDSPTNLILSCVTAGTDRCFAAGKLGTILEGRGNDWRVVEHDITDQQIFDAATFDGATYFSGYFGVLKLEDGELDLEWTIGPEIPSAGTLFVGPSGLWSIGSKTLALFDGDDWTVVHET